MIDSSHQLSAYTINKQSQNISKIISSGFSDQSLKQIQVKLKQNGFSYALFLFGSQFLKQLIKSNQVPTNKKSNIIAVVDKFSSSLLFQISIILQQSANYKQVAALRNTPSYKECMQQSYNMQNIKNNVKQMLLVQLMKAIIEAKNNQNFLSEAIQLSFKVKNQQASIKGKTTQFQQYAANYLNYCLQQIRKNNHVQVNYICCKTFFYLNEGITAVQNRSQQFKRYTWPITNTSIKNHIAKTIVGFMNSKGGVIFIGVMEKKDKKNEVVGIWLKQDQVKSIKDLIKQLVKNIHPKHQGFNEAPPQQQNLNHLYKINNFVSMEFLPVVDRNNFTNIVDDKKNSLYIVKIIAKIGHPKHLYHIVNLEKNLDFFERLDRNVEKKLFPDAYKQIYARLNSFQQFKKNGKKSLERQPFHNNCRYSMNMTLQDLILQSDRQDENDDDD